MKDFIIQLDEFWRIRRYDGMNFVLEYFQEGGINQKTKTQAPPKWVIKGHYGGLDKAIAAIPTELPFDPRIKDFDTLRKRMDAIAERLEKSADDLVSEVEKTSRALAEKLAGRMAIQ